MQALEDKGSSQLVVCLLRTSRFVRSYIVGNPRGYANWIDESLNKTLAAIGRMGHINVWQQRVFSYFKETETRRVAGGVKRHRAD